ncbi:hypothetical protein RI367_006245 [Sorochytrium milnesiophthora]
MEQQRQIQPLEPPSTSAIQPLEQGIAGDGSNVAQSTTDQRSSERKRSSSLTSSNPSRRMTAGNSLSQDLDKIRTTPVGSGSMASLESTAMSAAVATALGRRASVDPSLANTAAFPRRQSLRVEAVRAQSLGRPRVSMRKASIVPELGLYSIKAGSPRSPAQGSPSRDPSITMSEVSKNRFVSIPENFRQGFGGAALSRKFQDAGTSGRKIIDEYYAFYYDVYKKQWQQTSIVALLASVLFSAYMMLIIVKQNPRVATRWLGPSTFLLSVIPAIDLLLSLHRNFHRRHGLWIHTVLVFAFGATLAAMEMFLTSVHPPGYMFIYLLTLYSGAFQPASLGAAVGITVSALDVMFTVLAKNLSEAGLIAQADGGGHDPPYLVCSFASLGSSCVIPLVATAILHVVANTIGILYNINNWNYTRKTFLYHSDLTTKNDSLESELRKADYIALSILPKRVWDELKGGKHQQFDFSSVFHKALIYKYNNVTVLFADIVGFTALSGTVTASELVKILNHIFFEFDRIVEFYGIEKIKTIGDWYIHHEMKAVLAAFRMIQVVEDLNRKEGRSLAVRVGIHTGNVFAGLVGDEKFIFDVFSKDVSIASAVEQTGSPNRVHISEVTYQAVSEKCRVEGHIAIDGQGGKTLQTYFVTEVTESATAEGGTGQPLPNSTLGHIQQLTRTITADRPLRAGSNASSNSKHRDPFHRTRMPSNAASFFNSPLFSLVGSGHPTLPRSPESSTPSVMGRVISGFGPQRRRSDAFQFNRGKLDRNPYSPPDSPGASSGTAADHAAILPSQHGSLPRIRKTSTVVHDLASSAAADLATPPLQSESMSPATPQDGTLARMEERALLNSNRMKKRFAPKNEVNPFTCRFRELALETEYYENYLSNCAGKFAFATASGLLVSVFLSMYDILIFGREESYLSAFLVARFLAQAPIFLVLVAKFLHPALHDPLDHPEASPTLKLISRVLEHFRSLDLNVIAPFFLLSSAAVALLHTPVAFAYARDQSVKDFMIYISSELHIIMLSAMLFIRSSSIVMCACLLVAVLAFIVPFATLVADLSSISMIGSHGVYLGVMLLGVYLVCRRNELYIRTNYLIKRQMRQRQFEIEDVRVKSERLLLKLLPKTVVEMLKVRKGDGKPSEIAESVERAGILFCTICQFKEFDKETMTVLNDIISKFDHMLPLYDIEKIKSIGLSQVFGEKIPSKELARHPFNLANFALALKSRLAALTKDYSRQYQLKIGLDIGPIVAGIIGKNKFSFDVWGDTVNCASRMDSTNIEDRIQVTERLYHILKSEFVLEERGLVQVKGKGQMRTYFLLGRRSDYDPLETVKLRLRETQTIAEDDDENISSATSIAGPQLPPISASNDQELGTIRQSASQVITEAQETTV